jgi:hypothetical protein
MSKLFKKTLRRVSWLNGSGSDTLKYPLGVPEVPNDQSESLNGLNIVNWANMNGLHSPSSPTAATRTTVTGTQAEFQVELPEAENTSSQPITLAIIGAGQRGKVCTLFFYYPSTTLYLCGLLHFYISM